MQWVGLVILFAVAYGLLVVLLTLSLYRSLRRPGRFTYAAALGRGFVVEPAELGLEAREEMLRDAHGKTTPAWLIAGHNNDGPIVIMLHGFGRSRYSSLDLAPTLAPHASLLVLPDLPGHGESAARGSYAGVTEYRDVLAFATQVRDGERPIVLYGRSMGAGIAIAAAAHEPGLFAGVIAEGAYRTWHEPIRRRLRLRRYPVQPMLSLAGLMFRVLVAGLGEFDRVALAGRLRCPLLVMHGCDDLICPLEDARAIAAAAPLATLVEFPGGMHLNLHTHDAPRHREAVAAFFATLRDRGDAGRMDASPAEISATEPVS